jgi:hypothetical protein
VSAKLPSRPLCIEVSLKEAGWQKSAGDFLSIVQDKLEYRGQVDSIGRPSGVSKFFLTVDGGGVAFQTLLLAIGERISEPRQRRAAEIRWLSS